MHISIPGSFVKKNPISLALIYEILIHSLGLWWWLWILGLLLTVPLGDCTVQVGMRPSVPQAPLRFLTLGVYSSGRT